MGDPAGVGPEICLRLLVRASREPDKMGGVPIVFGDADLLQRVAEKTGIAIEVPSITWPEELPHVPSIAHVDCLDANSVVPGLVDRVCGRAAYDYIQSAIDAAIARRVAAVTTAPIHKGALHQAGIDLPGHTEMFAARCDSDRWCMMQYSSEITCSFVTVHVGYRDVPDLLDPDRILDVIELTDAALRAIEGTSPLLMVCGLNPHAGEGGLFGDREEERLIMPAIETARRRGIRVEGPVPPDTAFLPANRQRIDGFVCMYHDQGHIPVKALAFDSAVNTTLGIPIVRTSVDHGTAFDIAWQGIADCGSLFSAFRLAVQLSQT